ncbi:MAG: class I SAM-dependent methyltransferase [Candidatus Sabulitectum sp.]|nr:class I SAM-dependent methyltransferase [Candidatus Sabulitectum sp.]
MHSLWYYELYETVFSRPSSVYAKEIDIISNYAKVDGSDILEIGVGTGNHASALLKLQPKLLDAIDMDSKAISISFSKLGSIPNVSFFVGDGFSFSYPRSYDLVYIMYSVISQGVFCFKEFGNRIAILLRLLKNADASIIFEILDKTQCMKRYPTGIITELYRDSNQTVSVQWDYPPNWIVVKYLHTDSEKEFSRYTVKILDINIDELGEFLSLMQIGIRVVPLDTSGRRKLVVIRHL